MSLISKNFTQKLFLQYVLYFVVTITALCLFNVLFLLAGSSRDFTSYYSFMYSNNILGLALLYSGVVVGFSVLFLSDVKTFFKKTAGVAGMILFFYAI